MDKQMVERVLKLFALAAGTSFPAEAAAARAKAEALIARHKITLPHGDRGALDAVRFEPHFKGAKWEYMLLDAAASLCGCRAFFYTDDNDGLQDYFLIAGSVADLEACQYLIAALNEQRMGAWMRVKASGSADRFHSFCYSFARGVTDNVSTRIRAAELERSQAAYLYVKDTYGFSKKHVDLGLHGRGRSDAGRSAGEAASLHRGNVGGGEPVRRIRDH